MSQNPQLPIELQRSLTRDPGFGNLITGGSNVDTESPQQTAASSTDALVEQCSMSFNQDLRLCDSLPTTSPFCSAATAEIVKAFEVKHCTATVNTDGGPTPPSVRPEPCSTVPAVDSSSSEPTSSVNTCGPSVVECISAVSSLTATLNCAPSTAPPPASAIPAGCQPGQSCPPHGVKAVCGKRSKMEDAFAVQTNFFDLRLSPVDDVPNKLPARIAIQVGEQLELCTPSPTSSSFCCLPLSPDACTASMMLESEPTSCGGAPSAASSSSDSSGAGDILHFFAVYDGHGGTEAAQHCSNRLHYHLSEALAVATSPGLLQQGAVCIAGPNGQGLQCQAQFTLSQESGGYTCCSRYSCPNSPTTVNDDMTGDVGQTASTSQISNYEHVSQAELEGAFNDTASSGSGSDSSSRSEGVSITQVLEEALREAFLKTDEEFALDGSAAMVGSTAVVALLGSRKMWLANCGDSRAVLCRGGKAIQLTDDHKPEREDEAERVEKAGGQVLFWNGHRVMGVLAMSRAIGDHGLRPYVIPEPEITVVSRSEEDDFLLLASDGLWDVMSNQEATTLAMRCLSRAWERGASRKAAVRIAASVLTKAAIDRGSKDNVTVVIVDLRAPKPTASDGTAVGCECPAEMANQPCAAEQAAASAAAVCAASKPTGACIAELDMAACPASAPGVVSSGAGKLASPCHGLHVLPAGTCTAGQAGLACHGVASDAMGAGMGEVASPCHNQGFQGTAAAAAAAMACGQCPGGFLAS